MEGGWWQERSSMLISEFFYLALTAYQPNGVNSHTPEIGLCYTKTGARIERLESYISCTDRKSGISSHSSNCYKT